jgi:CheY-like chemotaxis protein
MSEDFRLEEASSLGLKLVSVLARQLQGHVRLEGSMDGIEAARHIRAARTVPVLFLTAHAASGGEQEQTGLHPCLSKPFRTAELQAALTQALDQGGSHRSSPEKEASGQS